jgi:hypothetical protein
MYSRTGFVVYDDLERLLFEFNALPTKVLK